MTKTDVRTTAESSEVTPAPRFWLSRSEHDAGFAHWVRLGLALAGAGAFVFAGFDLARGDSPELGATALIIVGAVLLVLAVLGRMPERLSAAGFELEFSSSSLKEILKVVQSEAPDIFDTVASLASGGSRTSKAVATVIEEARAERQKDTRFETEVLTRFTSKPGSTPDANSLSRFPGFKINPAIDSIPGRGRPPLIDAAFDFANTRIAVEAQNSWSRTTASVVRQRLMRVLTSPDFGAAVLIVPDDVAREATTDMNDSRIVVISADQADTLEASLRSALTAV